MGIEIPPQPSQRIPHIPFITFFFFLQKADDFFDFRQHVLLPLFFPRQGQPFHAAICQQRGDIFFLKNRILSAADEPGMEYSGADFAPFACCQYAVEHIGMDKSPFAFGKGPAHVRQKYFHTAFCLSLIHI